MLYKLRMAKHDMCTVRKEVVAIFEKMDLELFHIKEEEKV